MMISQKNIQKSGMLLKRLALCRAHALPVFTDPGGAGHAPEALTTERPYSEIVTHG